MMRRISLEDQDQLYFLHIQKTAGISLMNTLNQHFPAHEYRHYLLEQLLFLPDTFVPQRLIAGHTYFTIRHFLAEEPIYLTLLRDPVARVISHFRHIQRKEQHPYHLKFRDASLLDFLHSPEGESISRNFQTLSLAIDQDPREFYRNFTYEKIKGNGGGYAMMAAYDQSNQEALLERVLARLEKFAFIGLTERFEDSLDLLTYTFHWNPLARPVHLNADPEPLSAVPQEAYDLIIERTRLDQQIYDYAFKLLETRRREMALDLLHTDYTYQLPEISREARMNSASLDALPPQSAPFLKALHGWDDGWVGPRWVQSASLPPSTKHLKITGTTQMRFFKRPLVLTIVVEGKRVQQVKIRLPGRFTFTIPVTNASVEIVANQYFVPAQLGLNADYRPLSWIIQEIKLKRQDSSLKARFSLLVGFANRVFRQRRERKSNETTEANPQL
ncbi:MAG: sulfotransferase family 2 domain-containing protein [Chloroflexota bacterium]